MGANEVVGDFSELNIAEAARYPATASTVTTDRNGVHPQKYTRPQPLMSRDITADYTAASEALRHGQLIKDEDFTLFEAVGALEIMDPKMDSGFAVPDQDAAMEDFDAMNYSLPEEIIGIMDQILSFEMSWHDGYPLSQNVFTSLHINGMLSNFSARELSDLKFRTRHSDEEANKSPLVTTVLRTYCLAVIKSCDSAVRQIMSEHYYEEEDFSTSTFNLDLAICGADETTLHEMIEEALKVISNSGLPSEVSTALSNRMQLQDALIDAFTPEVPATEKKHIFEAVIASLPAIDQSHTLAKEVPEAFSERVQRYLASNAPPRPMVKTSWPETIKHIDQMCKDLIEAGRLSECFPHPAPQALMLFAWSFSGRNPQPNTYSRAVMQSLYFRSSAVLETTPHVDLLLADLRDLVLAGDPLLDQSNWAVELPSDPRHILARKLDDFVVRANDEYLNLIRMSLQNRCRVRRTFAQSIAIVDSLQAAAEDADTEIQAITKDANPSRLPRHEPATYYPLSSWVFYHKLRSMERVLLLGFELEVYLPSEASSMYALQAHLSTTRFQHTEHLYKIVSSRQRRLMKVSLRSPTLYETQQSLAYLAVLLSQASATAHLSSALSTLYTLCQILHLVPTRQEEYGSGPLRQELRLKPFLPAGTPALPSHEELYSATHPGPDTPIADLIIDAEENLKLAKQNLQKLKTSSADDGRFKGVEKAWKDEIQGLLFTAVGTGLALAKVKEICTSLRYEKTSDVDGDKVKTHGLKMTIPTIGERERWHPWWVVPKLTIEK